MNDYQACIDLTDISHAQMVKLMNEDDNGEMCNEYYVQLSLTKLNGMTLEGMLFGVETARRK